jgi:hypothetical protein
MRKYLLIFIFSVTAIQLFSQIVDIGAGLFFYNVKGRVLTLNAGGTQYSYTDLKNASGLSSGPSVNAYFPIIKKSSDMTVGIFTGASCFSKFSFQYDDEVLYDREQLNTKRRPTGGLQIPLMISFRLGAGASRTALKKSGVSVGAGAVVSYFSYSKYYYDKFLYCPPAVNADLALGKARFRFCYLLLPYKTYYIFSSGKKESKYNFGQFSATLTIQLNND